MSVLAAFLLAVAVADLAGGRLHRPGRPRPALRAGTAVLVLVLVATLADLSTGTDIILLVGAAVGAVAWALLAARAAETDRGHGLAIGVLGLGLGGAVLVSGAPSPAGGILARWLGWTTLPGLGDLSADRFLLLLALFTLQLSTANTVVRLVLSSVGAIKQTGQPQPSDRLRGGRLLGPMERVFILGLGLAGQVTAAGLVIAAKGLIRWPELQATPNDPRADIDEVTEYFLLGSFVSWLVALGALWLAH